MFDKDCEPTDNGWQSAGKGQIMKRSHLIAVLAGFMAIVAFANTASAYYHPGMGRFTSRDPGPARVGSGGMAAGGPFVQRDPYADGANLYQYGKSNPMRYVDHSGLDVSYPGSGGHQRVVNASSYDVTIHGDWEEFTTSDGVVRYPGTKQEQEYFVGLGLSPVVRHADEVLRRGESSTTARMKEGRFIVDADYIMMVSGAITIYNSRKCNCGAELETDQGAIKWTGGRAGHKLGHNYTTSRTYVVGDCVIGDTKGVWVEDEDDLTG